MSNFHGFSSANLADGSDRCFTVTDLVIFNFKASFLNKNRKFYIKFKLKRSCSRIEHLCLIRSSN